MEEIVEKRGWISWFTWRTNKTLRQGICTTYVGHRHLPGLLKEWRHKVLPRSDLRSPGKISRLSEPPHSRWELAWKGEKEKKTWGKPVFPGTGPSLYFSGKLLYFKLYVEINGKYKVMQGQQTWPLSKPTRHSLCMHTKVLGGFTSSSGQGAC